MAWYPDDMVSIARVVAPDLPHHVTQRGNRRQQTFFGDEDYRMYLGLMAEWCGLRGVDVCTYGVPRYRRRDERVRRYCRNGT